MQDGQGERGVGALGVAQDGIAVLVAHDHQHADCARRRQRFQRFVDGRGQPPRVGFRQLPDRDCRAGAFEHSVGRGDQRGGDAFASSRPAVVERDAGDGAVAEPQFGAADVQLREFELLDPALDADGGQFFYQPVRGRVVRAPAGAVDAEPLVGADAPFGLARERRAVGRHQSATATASAASRSAAADDCRAASASRLATSARTSGISSSP